MTVKTLGSSEQNLFYWLDKTLVPTKVSSSYKTPLCLILGTG